MCSNWDRIVWSLTPQRSYASWNVWNDDGKQPKTFGLCFLILQYLTFLALYIRHKHWFSSSKSYCFFFYFFTIIDQPIFDTCFSYHTVATVALEKLFIWNFPFDLYDNERNDLRVCAQYSRLQGLHLALRILSLTHLTESLKCCVTVTIFVTWSHNIVHDDFCLLPATRLLSRPSPRMTKGNLIGYTTGGLPIYNFQTPQSVLTTLQSLLRQIVEQSESRQIFYFLCLNLVSGRFYRFRCNIGLSVFVINKFPWEFPLISFVFLIPLSQWYTVQHRSTFVDQLMLNIVATCWILIQLLLSNNNILARSWNGGRGNVAVALRFERCRRYHEAATKKDAKTAKFGRVNG